MTSPLASSVPTPIWIDTDIIFNRFAGDVDDGLALMMALHSPRVHIRGISLNRNVDNGERVTRRLLGHYARYPVPVHKGADNFFAGPGESSEAVEALAAALRAGPLTIVAIGAATNLANLLQFHPEVVPAITRVVFCAGRREGLRFQVPNRRVALPDANFDNDPVSMLRVIESGIPITLAGFEASSSIFIDGQDIRRIRRNGRPGDRWVARRLDLWRLLWRLALGLDRFIPFDACTIGHVLYPECFHYHRNIPVAARTRANDARFWKKGAEKTYLEVSYGFETSCRVDYVHAIDPAYKIHLMNHLLGEPA